MPTPTSSCRWSSTCSCQPEPESEGDPGPTSPLSRSPVRSRARRSVNLRSFAGSLITSKVRAHDLSEARLAKVQQLAERRARPPISAADLCRTVPSRAGDLADRCTPLGGMLSLKLLEWRCLFAEGGEDRLFADLVLAAEEALDAGEQAASSVDEQAPLLQ